jgi:CBS domain-containing protein
MVTVAQLLQDKGRSVWTIAPDATVYDALSLMAAKNVGALIVQEGARVVGILSERDYARKVILKGKFSKDTLVHEIMTERVFFVRPIQTVEECMALMTAEHIRHLPVLDEEQLVGIISIGDVVKATISEKEFLIVQLQDYISGGHGRRV